MGAATGAYIRCTPGGQVILNYGGRDYCVTAVSDRVPPPNVPISVRLASGVTTQTTLKIEVALVDAQGITQTEPEPEP